MMDKKAKLISGFTLIEILIAIAIMLIMFMVGYASLSSPKSENKLKAAQREVASAISMAHSYALQGKTQKNSSGDIFLPIEYRFRFIDNNTYGIYCTGCVNPVEKYDLSNGVNLSNPSAANTIIKFSVPNGEASFPSGTSLSFTLRLGTSGATKTVNVDSSGAVISESQ
jgi:prepilin-type N-terminal cleavage/methylation domain-containing protein